MTGTSKVQEGRGAATGAALRLGDFLGAWQLCRRIEDRKGGAGAFEGRAEFAAQGDGLVYVEEGRLTLDRGGSFGATRRYLWQMEGDGVAVLFDDGRFFHRFSLAGRPEAAHFCDPDQYDVVYDFAGWPLWQSRWTVTGPRKDYTMTTRYTRA